MNANDEHTLADMGWEIDRVDDLVEDVARWAGWHWAAHRLGTTVEDLPDENPADLIGARRQAALERFAPLAFCAIDVEVDIDRDGIAVSKEERERVGLLVFERFREHHREIPEFATVA